MFFLKKRELDTNEIRRRFLVFFKKQNHSILDSSPVITSDEKGVTNSTLFNTAGVQPIIPNILSGSHPSGDRLASSQKCIRTVDIDEVGDNTHLTFFEMLGNWSIGDYFKEDSIKWSYEFLTDKKKGLGLDPNRLYITVFAGNENAGKDLEAIEIWKKYVPENRIFELEDNWWEAGDSGPCGPDTEMFYDLSKDGLGDISLEEFKTADDKQSVVEIWNNVFMQFEKKEGKIIGKLNRYAVDTGAGLERLTLAVNSYDSVYENISLKVSLDKIKENCNNYNIRDARIIVDHLRASIFIISEDITPSNTERGYILRRLLRKVIRLSDKLDLGDNGIQEIIHTIIESYNGVYELDEQKVISVVNSEREKFRKTLKTGLKEFEKISQKGSISGVEAFKLFSTYGFPIELTIDLAKEKGVEVDLDEYDAELKKHRNSSRTAAAGKFKGGLSGDSDIEIKYHTVTHLLNAALRQILGEEVQQKGSNINADRLRFDFSWKEKMTDEQKKEVEDVVNNKISDELEVVREEMKYDEAKEKGAIGVFEDKYEDNVTVYSIKNKDESIFSMELCGGPHVKSLKGLGKFKIKKEESSSAGVRRIKAVLE
jgi:alanyl-tRNA synthetase